MLEQYKKRLLDHFQQCSPHLDPGLRLSGLSRDLQIPSRHISQVVNQAFGVNFNAFVNQYRIWEFKNLVAKGMLHTFSIEGLIRESGFNSKTTFYKAFQELESQDLKDFLLGHQVD